MHNLSSVMSNSISKWLRGGAIEFGKYAFSVHLTSEFIETINNLYLGHTFIECDTLVVDLVKNNQMKCYLVKKIRGKNLYHSVKEYFYDYSADLDTMSVIEGSRFNLDEKRFQLVKYFVCQLIGQKVPWLNKTSVKGEKALILSFPVFPHETKRGGLLMRW